MLQPVMPRIAVGPWQIIPSSGAHTQFLVKEQTIHTLLTFGLIGYDEDYGPNARVYRPIKQGVDAAQVARWLGPNA
jgi:hypothetical protein